MEVFDKARTCPKCGGSDMYDRYHRQRTFGEDCSFSDIHRSGDEHIHRFCRTCQYDWLEAPLKQQAHP